MIGRLAQRTLLVGCVAGLTAPGQTTNFYRGVDATGRLIQTATTNVSQIAAGFTRRSLQEDATFGALSLQSSGLFGLSLQRDQNEFKRNVVEPQRGPSRAITSKASKSLSTSALATMTGFGVSPTSSALSFLGLTHHDQRNANGGNQFSTEPPSPDLAAANGWVLQGVNNAIQVYSTAGTPLLPKVLSTNELFAVPPAIDRTTGINGVYPTDMRVFYDHDIDRWFVVQRAQDYDAAGSPLATSHLYVAVSQTGNPTGSYNIYTMDTTNFSRRGCPCFSDFPQIGADQFGIYISVDEYNSWSGLLADVSILAIAKASLASGSPVPRMAEFVIPRRTGYEATVRPAMTPPGASYAVARGGVQFFLSTHSLAFSDSSFGLWALTNTASLNTNMDLTLTQTIIPGIPYAYPFDATQRPGPLPYGSTLSPAGQLSLIHGGRDSRILSLVYAAGRLYATFATDVLDETGQHVVGGAYAILYPSFRGLTLSAPVWRHGYILVNGAHVLRPAVAVTPQGRGAIAFTLVGPTYFPSAAFVPVEGFLPTNTIQVAGPGVAPQDGFTGYPDMGFITTGVARWGDYSGAVATADGSIWMTTEYIPAAPRTEFANWGTRIIRYQP